MIQAIIEHIARTPERVALLNEEGEFAFAQLGARCQGIIDVLRNGPNGVVLVYGHKQIDSVAAMFACMLLGRPFVFVDTAIPLARIAQIARTADARMVICAQPLPGQLSGLVIETDSVASRSFVVERYEPNTGLFCIVFTSGSSGAPKGVRIGHDNFNHFFRWYGAVLKERPVNGAHVNHASLSFDMGMLDLWPSLAVGKSVILLDHRHNPLPRANLRLLTRSQTTAPATWFSTPTFVQLMCMDAAFNQSMLPHLRSIFLGGEPVQRCLVAKLMQRFPDAEIWHAYGPTEVTCLTHCLRLTSSHLVGSGPLPLGRPMPPSEVRVVDDAGLEVAAGEYGEIELSGPQVAHGYLSENQLCQSAFGMRNGTPFYRTGDYGTVDYDGGLRLSGRRDGQLKWNGNRIEAEEIERVAVSAPGVQNAAVVPLLSNGRVIDVMLFIQLIEDSRSKREAFVSYLTGLLPTYMRPRSLRFLDQLPMTFHGKIDRARLAHEMTTLRKDTL